MKKHTFSFYGDIVIVQFLNIVFPISNSYVGKMDWRQYKTNLEYKTNPEKENKQK